MKKLLLKGLSMVMMCVLVLSAAACGGGSPSTPAPASAPAPAAPATPAQTAHENVLNVGPLPGTANLDTQMIDGVWMNRGAFLKVLMFRSLLIADPTLTEVKPDLASAYTISEDGLTYTFTIKDGITWHDGTPFTTDDVIWSIETALKAAQVNGIYTGAFNRIVGAEDLKSGKAASLSGITVDGNVITIKVNAPVGNFLNVMGQFAILPKHLLKDEDPLKLQNSAFWQKPVGNGMYRFEKFEPGSYCEIVPYENYDGEKPKIAKVRQTQVADIVAAAQAGQLDYYNTNVPAEITEFDKLTNFASHPVDTLFFRYFVCNIKDENGKGNPKLEDVRIRQALMYAIDRQSLADALYPGLAKLANTGVPIALPEYNKDSEPYAYNPVKAKELLEAANFDFSQTLKLRYYYADQTSVDFMTAIAQYWTEVGIKVDVAKFQGDATTELYSVKDYDLALKGLSAFGYEEWYGEYQSSNANFSKINGKDGYFDAKSIELAQTTDPAKRAVILSNLQKLEQQHMYKLPLFTLQNKYYVNSDKVTTAGIYGNPWFNYDMQFAKWEIQ